MNGRTRSLSSILPALALVVLMASSASADPGDLDTTFSRDGTRELNFVYQDLYNCCERGEAVVVQPDNKLVVAGEYPGDPSASTEGGGSIVFRLNPGGTLDQSFGTGGKAIVDFGDPSSLDFSTVFDVVLQANGKIVTVGQFRQDFLVARYTTDGHLDPTFNHDGVLRTNFGGREGASRLAIQPDGKIVVVGSFRVRGTFDYKVAVARYTRRGNRDPTFDGDGKLILDVPAEIERSQSVALMGDGRIVIGSDAGSGQDFNLVRLMPDGSPDGSFGTGGVSSTAAIGGDGFLGSADIALQGNKIIVSGNSGSFPDGFDFAVARFLRGGTLDASFGTGGVTTTDILGYADTSYAVAVQDDGKVIVAGTARDGGMGDSPFLFGLVRYSADGLLDPSFGGDGKLTTSFPLGGAFVQGIALGNGKIAAAGFDYDQNVGDFAFAVARYLG
jgi:uncharacterized delta-60 repeat protein